MAIRCEIKLKKKSLIAIFGTGQTILRTKCEGCICTRKRPVALLIFHLFVSFLFLPSREKKKHTRIVCRPARLAAKTVIRSISCSLQLRLKAPAKRSQHGNATYHNTVGCNMLRAIGHRVATCWVSLARVWKWSNLSQQRPTRRNTVAKRTQHVAPTVLRYVALACWDRLAGA